MPTMLTEKNLEEISKPSTPSKKSIRVTLVLSKDNLNQNMDENSPHV